MTIAVNRNLSNCKKARKKGSRASTGFEPVANKLAGLKCMGLHNPDVRTLHAARTQRPRVRIPLKPRKTIFRAISQLLKLRFTAMATYSFQIVGCRYNRALCWNRALVALYTIFINGRPAKFCLVKFLKKFML